MPSNERIHREGSRRPGAARRARRGPGLGAAVLAAATLAASPAVAGDFDDGFERELGRIAARAVVGAVVFGVHPAPRAPHRVWRRAVRHHRHHRSHPHRGCGHRGSRVEIHVHHHGDPRGGGAGDGGWHWRDRRGPHGGRGRW